MAKPQVKHLKSLHPETKIEIFKGMNHGQLLVDNPDWVAVKLIDYIFILAGISSRYALVKHSGTEWIKTRTRKLLVPSTIGLFFLGAGIDWINTTTSPAADTIESLPIGIKYIIWALSGTGPLWFIQDLWLLSVVLLIIRKIEAKGKFMELCGKAGIVPLILMGIFFWIGHQTLIMEPNPAGANGLWNLYKPVFYLIPFLMGYFVFSHDNVQEIVGRAWIPLMLCAVASGIALIITGFGQDNTLPQYLCSPLNNIYGWLMCLAMMGWFKSKFDRTGRFASYMTRSSYGIYIVHYLIIAVIGSMLKLKTQMHPAGIYIILTAAVFTLSPLFYELLKRIPFIRWCVLGEKKQY